MVIVPVLLPSALGGGHLTLRCSEEITAGEFKHQVIDKINIKRLADLSEQNYKLAKLPLGSEADDSILEDPAWESFRDDTNMMEQCCSAAAGGQAKLCFAVTLQLTSGISHLKAEEEGGRRPKMTDTLMIDPDLAGFEAESTKSLMNEMDEYLRNRPPKGGAEDGGVDESGESPDGESDSIEFGKLKQDSRRAREITLELAALEKFIQKFRKQATSHVAALRTFFESTRALADTFKEFYHYARSDPFMSKVSEEFSTQTVVSARELVKATENEWEAQAPFLEQWTIELNKTKTQLRLREAAKRRYIHYISKLTTLAENSKKTTGVLSGKKQTQLKRNRLKLAHAKQAYEKCCRQAWNAFDICWDCQYTQVNPMFAHTVGQEVSRFVSYQSYLAKFEEPMRIALNDSFREHQPLIQAHLKAQETDEDPQPVAVVDPVELEAEQHRMEAVTVEYDLHDMLATVLDGDITVAVQSIAEDQLCSRMPIVGCVLASFPRRDTIEALMQRAAASPAISQCVGCLNACFIVRPPKLLADVPASRDLADFFLNFHTTVAMTENCLGMDFKVPPNTFHPFQVGTPIRRLVVIKSFISNAKPLLLAAYSEYEELPIEEQRSPPPPVRSRGSAFGLRDLATRASSGSTTVENTSSAFSPPTLTRVASSPLASPRSSSSSTSSSSSSPSSSSPSQRDVSDPKPVESSPVIRRKESMVPARKEPPPPVVSPAVGIRKKPAPPSSPRPTSTADPPSTPPTEGTERKGDEKQQPESKILERQDRRPLWWENLSVGRLPDLIFKYGDDLRTDQAVQHLFRLMNHLWKSQKLDHKGEPVEAHVYKVQALSSRMGLVEFVPGCIPLSSLTKQAAYVLTEQKIDRIVVTSVAGYLAAFILGIKDRHSDNILIKEDATVFHIDFGHVLGRGVSIDTGPFAITMEFKEVLEQWFSWHSFVEVCEKAFLIMRLHADVVAEFATLLLRPIFPDEDIAAFVKKKLMVDMPLLDATLRLRKMVVSAPANYKTRLKNFVHGANNSYQTFKTALS